MPRSTVTTAHDARIRLHRLAAARRDALDAGIGPDAACMRALLDDIAASRAAYVGLAVTEIAGFRARLGGPQVG